MRTEVRSETYWRDWWEDDEPDFGISVEVPVRDADGALVTRACGAVATTACGRCGAPRCDAHAPADRRRCDACERAFRDDSMSTIAGVICMAMPVAGIAVLFGLLTLALGMWRVATWCIAGGAGGLVVVYATVSIDEALRRRRFLAQTPASRSQ